MALAHENSAVAIPVYIIPTVGTDDQRAFMVVQIQTNFCIYKKSGHPCS